MKKIFALICFAAVISSCEKIVGEGPVVTETRNEPPFQGLSVSVPAEAYFTQSPDYSITLQAQQNILDEIETVVSDNILKIRFRHTNVRISNSEKIIVHVTGPTATLLELNGSGSLEAEGTLDAAEIRLYVSGSGSIDAENIQANIIKTIVSGSGRIKVNGGTANEEEITISGSGFVDMSEVMVKDADTRISGSGNMEVYTTHTLQAKISGSGTVFYKGSPTISSQISGSGSVKKI
jgi:hypothetical protein